jgi:hypothetical protein
MKKSVFTVRSIKGQEKRIGRIVLEQLRMLMDWQLWDLGYDPTSINEACRLADE